MALYAAYVDKRSTSPIHEKAVENYLAKLQDMTKDQFFNDFGMEMAGGMMRADVRLKEWSDFIKWLKTTF